MAKQKAPDFTLARGKIGFTVSHAMRAPLKKVWEAATQAKHLEKFFVHKVRGDFNEKFEPVFWTWPSHGEFPLYPVAYAPGKYLEFHWQLYGSKNKFSHVRFEFAEKKGVVTVTISESSMIHRMSTIWPKCRYLLTMASPLAASNTHSVPVR